MNTKFKSTKLTNTVILLMFLSFVNSCGIYKYSDANKNPVNSQERVKKNQEEGRGFKLGKGKKSSGEFDFSTSNVLWRASLSVLDFAPLVNADYAGGIIITDWITDETNNNSSVKITVHFLSNEIRADGIDVVLHEKKCAIEKNCRVEKINSNLNNEIKLAILKKAALLEQSKKKKKKDKKGKLESGKPLNKL